jgi:uncharacterized membrane protein
VKKVLKNTFKIVLAIAVVAFVVALCIVGIKSKISIGKWMIDFPKPWNIVAIVVAIVGAVSFALFTLLDIGDEDKKSEEAAEEETEEESEENAADKKKKTVKNVLKLVLGCLLVVITLVSFVGVIVLEMIGEIKWMSGLPAPWNVIALVVFGIIISIFFFALVCLIIDKTGPENKKEEECEEAEDALAESTEETK